MTDLDELLSVIKERVRNALVVMTGSQVVEILDLNARVEPRMIPYARVGIAEVVHSDFTVSSDSLMVNFQIVAVVKGTSVESNPQSVQFELSKQLHLSLFGSSYENSIVSLQSGRVARLIPSTRTSYLSDIEQAIAERAPDCTSVTISMVAEVPLGGLVF